MPHHSRLAFGLSSQRERAYSVPVKDKNTVICSEKRPRSGHFTAFLYYYSGLASARKEGENFENTRIVRNIFKKSITPHADRIMSTQRFREEERPLLTKADIIRSIKERVH